MIIMPLRIKGIGSCVDIYICIYIKQYFGKFYRAKKLNIGGGQADSTTYKFIEILSILTAQQWLEICRRMLEKDT